MITDIEKTIGECSTCALVQSPLKPEPLTMTQMPSCWDKLNVDLCGPFPDGWSILGVIDAGSRWPEALLVKSTSTPVITEKLTELFCNKGRPLEIVTDNGPQFTSLEFGQFCKKWGIKHHRVTPYYPQANSEVERFFKTLLKTIRLSVAEGKDLKQELRQYLLTYRNTPHSTTGKSPAELFYGRPIRDTLPSLNIPMSKVYKDAVSEDTRRKQIMKSYADRSQKLKELPTINEGDSVILRQQKRDKFTTPFSPVVYRVLKRNKATLTVQHPSGRIFKRHASAARVIKNPPQSSTPKMNSSLHSESDSSDGFDSDSEDEDKNRHLPQTDTSSSNRGSIDRSTFVRRSSRLNAGGGVDRYNAG